MAIRPATPEDASAIAAVDAASWRAAYADLMPAEYLAALPAEAKAREWATDIARHGPTGRKRWFVAESDGAVVGYALTGIPTGATRGMLYFLYTLPETWGAGVGPALLAASMAGFEDLGVVEADLWVLAQNARARRFYERAGWQPTGNSSSTDYGGVALEGLEYRVAVGR